MREKEENTPSWRWVAIGAGKVVSWVLKAILWGVVFPITVNVVTAIILGNTPTQSFYANDSISIQALVGNDWQRERAVA